MKQSRLKSVYMCILTLTLSLLLLCIIIYNMHVGFINQYEFFGTIHTSTRRIPLILHQTWKTNTLLSFQENNRNLFVKTINDIDPRCICNLHTDKDFDSFVHEYFPDFINTWEELTPFIKKVDTIRYMWLYVYGGIYIDLDVSLINQLKFKKILLGQYKHKTCVFLSCSTYRPFIRTGPTFMMAHPGHEFFLCMLDYIKANKTKTVMNSTGPYAMTKCLKKYLNNAHQDNIVLISSSIMGHRPQNPFVGKIIHHQNEGTWRL